MVLLAAPSYLGDMTTKYDYPALKAEFLAADPPISVRQLCLQNDIPESRVSSITRMAREEEWVKLRDSRMVKTEERVTDAIAARVADRQLRRLEVEDNAMEAIDEAIDKMRSDMKRTRKEKDPETGEYVEVPVVTYRPEQVVQLIDRIDKLFATAGPAPAADGPKSLTQINFGSFDGNDPAHRALAADLVAATRPVGESQRGRAGDSPLPDSPDAR